MSLSSQYLGLFNLHYLILNDFMGYFLVYII
ncbi:hypothetical protein PTE_00374 [Photorhabdus khanii NC19]|uniref:Uncharacterized protein n=1 Tax=Photorhabdus khanii NC19 TaxID=1004151 RepID=W3VDP1_9GAMM|nr:hypothetical protein PTE_00374 [Photorhabdus khanii NC19]